LLDILATLKVAQNEKDLEIVMLRQQVRILQRKAPSSPRISKPEKLILPALSFQMKQTAAGFRNCLHRCFFLFVPETLRPRIGQAQWHPAISTTQPQLLVHLLEALQRTDIGLRLFHRGDDHSEEALRALLH
jgi:hypothetical protein